MKYDNNQYYYSPSKNYPWYLEDNKPDDAIPMTIEMEEEYEAGIKAGLVITPDGAGFKMVHPDSLLSQQQLEERARQQQLAQANNLLNQSIKLGSGVYQRRMSEEQKQDFKDWQDALLEFINGERQDMPEQPIFIQELL